MCYNSQSFLALNFCTFTPRLRRHLKVLCQDFAIQWVHRMDHEFAPPWRSHFVISIYAHYIFLLFTSFPHCSLKSCMPLAPQLSPRMLSAPLQMLLWQFSAPELLLGFLSTVKIRFFSTPRMDIQSCCANCCGKSCRKRPGKACRFGVRPPEHGQMSWGQLDEAMQHVQSCSSQLSSNRSALNLTTADRTFERGWHFNCSHWHGSNQLVMHKHLFERIRGWLCKLEQYSN